MKFLCIIQILLVLNVVVNRIFAAEREIDFTFPLPQGVESADRPDCRWSPDGSKLAWSGRYYTTGDGLRGQLWIIDIPKNEKRLIVELNCGIHNLSWAPDSKKLLFTAWIPYESEYYSKQVWFVDITTPTRVKQLTESEKSFGYATWSPDGKTILYSYGYFGPEKEGIIYFKDGKQFYTYDPDAEQYDTLWFMDAKEFKVVKKVLVEVTKDFRIVGPLTWTSYNKIIYISAGEASAGTCMVGIDGKKPKGLTCGWEYDLSPDHRKIAAIDILDEKLKIFDSKTGKERFYYEIPETLYTPKWLSNREVAYLVEVPDETGTIPRGIVSMITINTIDIYTGKRRTLVEKIKLPSPVHWTDISWDYKNGRIALGAENTLKLIDISSKIGN